MPTQPYRPGTPGKFTLHLWIEKSGPCPFFEFLEAVGRKNEKTAARVVSDLDFTLEEGPPRNEQKSRQLDGPIYELKPTDTVRVLYFYGAERRSIIITHGFEKKQRSTPRKEIKRAQRIYRDYQNEMKGRV